MTSAHVAHVEGALEAGNLGHLVEAMAGWAVFAPGSGAAAGEGRRKLWRSCYEAMKVRAGWWRGVLGLGC